ncbi:MAG: hypothetical protein J4224_03245 [Candidatus Diapherotrites archaeon]|uniref:Uncharacterized protein n=1 Tax=Candidatus Iainarchaeum sp. TaxID=3101447 RepID=A0A7J4IU09_9ARCH|nr:MAG: hypothetical protein QT03_C0001G0739 [archaeon GW2011_AR10]MBS3059414.1 hypothetical protein [Candidatus Diapherotrites archaeon]HIH08922.1 hypothetical protein [Candidatus Diapherotrites archaeon]
MANGKTVVLKKEAINELRKEANRLRSDFKGYLEDLELMSNPAFWKSVEELQSGKLKKYDSLEEFFKELES